MKKTFCDSCGQHIPAGNLAGEMNAIVSTAHSAALQVQVSVENEYVEDVCKYCLIDAINKLDNRAMPALPGGAA